MAQKPRRIGSVAHLRDKSPLPSIRDLGAKKRRDRDDEPPVESKMDDDEPIAQRPPNKPADPVLTEEMRKLFPGLFQKFPSLGSVGFNITTTETVAPTEIAEPVLPTEIQKPRTDFQNEAFRVYGPKMHALGWCVIPQEDHGDRRPARSRGHVVRQSLFYERRPGPAEFQTMLTYHSANNAALLAAESSDWTVFLDVDANEEDLAKGVIAIADEVFGYSPLRRVGRAPRIAIAYRCPPERDASGKIVWRLSKVQKQFGLAVPEIGGDGNEKESGDAVEILCNGAMLTAAGRHHKTGKDFQWLDKAPWEVGPEEAPVITRQQIENFLEKCNELRAFKRKRGGSQGGVDPTLVSEFVKHKNGVNRPLMKRWPKDGEEKIVEGREEWMRDFSLAICAGNGSECITEQGIQKLIAFAHWELRQRVEGDRKRTVESMEREIAAKIRATANKVRSAIAKMATGQELNKQTDIRPWNLHDLGNGRFSRPAAHIIPRVRPKTGELNWLGAGDLMKGQTAWERNKSAVRPLGEPVEIDGGKEARALILDRESIATKMARSVWEGLSMALADVLKKKASVHVLPHATGGGKSAQALTQVLRFAKANPRFEIVDGEKIDHGPIIVLSPTHANIMELSAKALKQQGVDVKFPLAEDFAAFARSQGVKAVWYKGATRPGMCHPERVEMRKKLHEAGVAADRLCHSVTKKKRLDGEVEEVEEFCTFYEACAVIQQCKDAEIADIVFMPHAYLTANYLPTVLNTARLVVCDETVTFCILNTAFLPSTSLRLPRKPPRLTKAEKETGMTAEELLHRRDLAVAEVEKAMADKRCPARALFDHPKGSKLVAAAKSVVGRAQDLQLNVHAEMSAAGVEDISQFGRGTDLLLEHRFWSVVEERMEWLALDQAGITGVHRAVGDREMRIQALVRHMTSVVDDGNEKVDFTGPTPGWRVSWRAKMNWTGAPWILLDASANPHITRKLFNVPLPKDGAEDGLHWHFCETPLNMRVVAVADKTYATSQFVPGEKADEKAKARAESLSKQTKQVIGLISGAHGWGKVLVTATTKVREHLFKDFAWPVNLDHGHLGALRGIDAYKNHVAHLAIGRTEMPLWALDGYVAALTFDMQGPLDKDKKPTPWAAPEEPYDKRGDGRYLDDEGKERDLMRKVKSRKVLLRSGHDVKLPVPEVDGFWGQLLDEQWRDEETRQAIGRLRPVYRTDTPTIVLMTSCIPAGIIVDEMISLDDLLAGARGKVWDAIRLAEGVVDPQLTPEVAAPEDRELVREACVEMIARPAYRLPGFTPVEWTTHEGGAGTALVVSCRRDGVEAGFRAAWSRAGMHPDLLDEVRVGQPRKAVVEGGEAAEDWLMREIGGRDMAMRREEDLLHEARAAIVEQDGADAIPFMETAE